LLAFLVQSAAAFYELGEMTDADKGMNSLHFGTPGSGTTSATFVQPTLTVELSRNIIFAPTNSFGTWASCIEILENN